MVQFWDYYFLIFTCCQVFLGNLILIFIPDADNTQLYIFFSSDIAGQIDKLSCCIHKSGWHFYAAK